MLIALAGPECAGKSSIADYLVQRHGFRRVWITSNPDESSGQEACRNKKSQMLALVHGMQDSVGITMDEQASSTTFSLPNSWKTVEELCEYATLHWQENLITTSIKTMADYCIMAKRPFFLLVGVDAPLGARFQRYSRMIGHEGAESMPLSDYVERSDSFYTPGGMAEVLYCATVRIINTFASRDLLEEHLESLELAHPDRIRPSWDTYFMRLASLAAMRSNCMKRRVGCVLVRGKRVIATGYNGTPRGITNCNEGGCKRCNAATEGGQNLGTCLCLHAEENALLESGRERVGLDATLYCNTCPCLTCSVKIAQVGVKEVVFHQSYSMDQQSAKILKEAGVVLRQFSPPDQAF